ncbi:MAG TPA: ABC transporter ATP-binding protein [Chthonomonas sp.]|jgi:ABC-2 type transport system ATP-binding protein|uniref:ABC transporter ATP-binding protein n=1 Tax=Chthonomonas sp. TaxID=2282153 RepID=UPI002B4ADE93|nr:ABC transporter ATP-binding protein [Chthonomonas sp.]HLH80450.1 ABC transporter ATP-binding protein [Chthonomonas sp.]HLI48982.1 ABC transporter ATP-binding protein [Chthonomonas sp.]
MTTAISIRGLTKKYIDVWQRQEVVAVNNLDLDVEEGEIFGFLGRNGAGKTTTIKMLLGLIFPTAGDAVILGKPMGDNSVKHLISYLPEETYFYESMTGWDLMDFYGRLFRIPQPERKRRIQICLEKVRLQPEAWHRAIRGYSKGMRQRIGIAQALINDPQLLFLDEPTSGLDPIAHAELRDIVASLKDEGKTVFLSSHQLADVEMICTRVAIIHRGKLLTTGTIKELVEGERTEITVRGKELANGLIDRLRPIATSIEPIGNDTLKLSSNDPERVSTLIDLVRGAKGQVISVMPHRRTLEEVFVETVRKEELASAGAAQEEGV